MSTSRERVAYLERAPVRSNDPLPPLHESLLVPHQSANFDDIAGYFIVQDFHCLGKGHTTS